MIRRTTKITLEILGAALAGAAIILAFLTWRLTQEGPIHLRFLSSYVEQALIRSDQPYRIAIDDTVLTWAGWDRALDVRAMNLRVTRSRWAGTRQSAGGLDYLQRPGAGQGPGGAHRRSRSSGPS